ncbi:csc1-like protein, partial [Quercus suber]
FHYFFNILLFSCTKFLLFILSIPTGTNLNCCLVQCLVKKDKEDLNDPTITEFYENLVTAYRDPVLSMQYPVSTDGRNTPLLHTA